MRISSDDIAPIITALGGFLTVVGGIVTNIIMTIRQGRQMNQRHDSLEAKVDNIANSTTATNKALHVPDDPHGL